MTVEVERAFEVGAPIGEVWEQLADERKRAETISVVDSFEVRTQNGRREVVWHLRLPIPFVDSTVAVRTRDIEREPPRYVKFVGRSKVMAVTGEHELSETAAGTHIVNRFVVDGKVPGVERFFERNIDGEIENFRQTLLQHVREVEGA